MIWGEGMRVGTKRPEDGVAVSELSPWSFSCDFGAAVRGKPVFPPQGHAWEGCVGGSRAAELCDSSRKAAACCQCCTCTVLAAPFASAAHSHLLQPA